MSTQSQPKASVEQPENQGTLFAGLTYGGVAQAYLELLKLQDVLLRLANDQAEITKTQLQVGSEVIIAAADAAKSSIKEDAKNLLMQATFGGITGGVTLAVTGGGKIQDRGTFSKIKPAETDLQRLNGYEKAMGNPAKPELREASANDSELQGSINELKSGNFTNDVNKAAVQHLEGGDPEGFKEFRTRLRDQQKAKNDEIHNGYSRLSNDSSYRQLLTQFGQQGLNSASQGIQSGYTMKKASDENQKATLQGALQTNIDPAKSSKQMSDKVDQSNQDLQLIQSLLSGARLQA